VALASLQRLAEDVGAEMALWQLLVLICTVLPVGTSAASARQAKVGPGGYAFALAIGLAVGTCCGWTMYTTHKGAVRKLQSQSRSQVSVAKQEWYFRGFYLAKSIWVAFAGFLGFWLSSALLRVIF
jgi:hypothetical protein